MQREIKFRAWDVNKGGMVFFNAFECWGFINHKLEPATSLRNGSNTLMLSDNPEKYRWMQFTGLTDKNGKEIYEGDVLQDDVRDLFEVKFGKLPLDKSGDCVCRYEAFYAKGYGKIGSAPSHECNIIGDWMEVIGNVYEHPLMLGVSAPN